MARKKLLIILLLLFIFISGCVSFCAYPGSNSPEDRGPYPVNYVQTVQKYLRKALYDPYSIRDLAIGKPDAESCLIGGRNLFHGWRVDVTYNAWRLDVTYNAKNRLGGYVGLKTYYHWFCNERLSAITEDFYYCHDIQKYMIR